MKRYTLLLLFLYFKLAANNSINNIPVNSNLTITENKGQITDINGIPRLDILYTGQANGIKLLFTKNSISYQFRRAFSSKANSIDTFYTKLDILSEMDSVQFYRVDIQLINANENPLIVNEEETNSYSNYYLAHCPEGILNVKSFRKIRYIDVYPNIDWVIYTNGNLFKYDFIVKPGGNVEDIKIRYEGASNVNIEKNGDFMINTPLGNVIELKPFSYQDDYKEVKSDFLLKENILSFDIDNYNHKKSLIIDPSIIWEVQFGGTSWDFSNALIKDPNENLYITGFTGSETNIATSGAHQTSLSYVTGSSSDRQDAFLAKYNSSGQLVWSTYYGGTLTDEAKSIAIDGSGSLYIAGTTYSSSSIATSGGFQNAITPGGYKDAFLAKFNSSGQRQWATYYGGSNTDEGYSVVTDASNNVILAGFTLSSNNIFSNGIQASLNGGTDAFIVKFNSAGQRLWGTYFGGNGGDVINSMATDNSGNIYLAGTSNSSTGLSYNGFQNTFGGGNDDAFVAKLNSSGQKQWVSYYGGNQIDRANAIKLDAVGNVFFAGYTNSSSNISYLGYQNNLNGSNYDAFLAKFDNSGQRIWATYFGGANLDSFTSLAIDNSGYIYTGGSTSSDALVSAGGFENTFGGYGGLTYLDALVVKFNASGQRLWSSYYYLAGPNDDSFTGVVTGGSGNVYLTGNEIERPCVGCWNGNATLIKIDGANNPVSITTENSFSNTLCAGDIINVSFSLSGTFYTGNVFKLELSDLAGSFINPVVIGTYSGTGQGTITGIIPVNTPIGTGYRIRVVSTDPAVAGSNNGTNISIYTRPTVIITPLLLPDIFCEGEPVTLQASGASSYLWNNGTTADSITVTTAGNYAVTGSNNGCEHDTSYSLIVTGILPTSNFNYTQTGTTVIFNNLSTDYNTIIWDFGDGITGEGTNPLHTYNSDNTYTVCLYVFNDCGSDTLCLPVSVNSTGMLTIPTEQISIYPNPACDKLNISTPFEEFAISIVSVEGKQLLSQVSAKKNTVIDISKLAKGIYFIEISDKNKIMRKRFIKE